MSESVVSASASNSNSQDSNIEELLGLCSGSFSVPAHNDPNDMITSTAFPATDHKLFEDSKSVPSHSSGTADTMDELIGLCSGKFPSQGPSILTTNMIISQECKGDDETNTEEKKGSDSGSCQSDDEIMIPTKKMKSDQSRLPILPKLGKRYQKES